MREGKTKSRKGEKERRRSKRRGQEEEDESKKMINYAMFN